MTSNAVLQTKFLINHCEVFVECNAVKMYCVVEKLSFMLSSLLMSDSL